MSEIEPEHEMQACRFCGSDELSYHQDLTATEIAITCDKCGAIGPVADDWDMARSFWNEGVQDA